MISAAVLTCVAPGAQADVVRVATPAGKFGQGWMFLDGDGVCKVVTAGHVIRGLAGEALPVTVFDARERYWPAGPAILNSTTPDVAVVPVPGASDPVSCGESRLSAIGVARRVNNLRNGVIRTTTESEIVVVPVTRRASAIDKDDGGIFVVQPTLAADQVRQGWSGSVILDDNGPLGIVYEVDAKGSNEVYAVRIDVVRSLINAAPRPLSAATSGTIQPALAIVAGSTIDLDSGPNLIFARDSRSWMVKPDRNVIVFTARFPVPTQIREVGLHQQEPPSNQIEAIDIGTSAGPMDGNWTPAGYCRSSPGIVQINCPFLARTVSGVRITVRTQTNASIHLNNLSLQ